MRTTFKLIGLTIVIVLIIVAIGVATGRFLGQDTMTLADVRSQNEELAAAAATAQAEVTNLKEVNARLQADIAGGRDVEEERRALQTRAQELDRREQNVQTAEQLLDERETQLGEREAKLRQSEQEFYESTNLTQQEIGQAKQIQTEYETMRTERDQAQQTANQWLMFIYGVSISAFVLLLVAVILAMRYWAAISRQRAEAEQRRQVVTLLSTMLSANVSPEERKQINSALGSLAGLPD